MSPVILADKFQILELAIDSILFCVLLHLFGALGLVEEAARGLVPYLPVMRCEFMDPAVLSKEG